MASTYLYICDPFSGTILILMNPMTPVFDRNYGEKLTKIFGQKVPAKLEAPTFGFPNTSLFCSKLYLNPRGLEVYRNLLCIIAYDYPDLLYCPFIPSLAALLLHQMSAYDTLGCIVSLIKRSETKAHHKDLMTSGPIVSLKASPVSSPTMATVSIDQSFDSQAKSGVTAFVIETNTAPELTKPIKISEGSWGYLPYLKQSFYAFGLTFIEVVSKYLKPVAKHTRSKLKLKEEEEYSIYIRLITEFYVGIIPFKFVYRILDMYFYEGYKLLFRFALAWINIRKDELLKTTTKEAFIEVLFCDRSATFTSTDFDGWMKGAFSGYNLTRSFLEGVHLKFLTEKESLLESLEATINPPTASFRPVPKIMNGESQFISSDDWYFVWKFIPQRFRLFNLSLCFSAKKDGYFLPNLYDACKDHAPLLIFIETFEGGEFGAFITEPFTIRENKKFIGNGETFIFGLRPNNKLFSWNSGPNGNNYFMLASNQSLAFGASR